MNFGFKAGVEKARVLISGSGCMLGDLKWWFKPEQKIWWSVGVCHGSAKTWQNRPKLMPCVCLVRGGFGGGWNDLGPFFLVVMQNTTPCAMILARKMHWWGSGVAHGHAGMSKNVQKPINGYSLFGVGGEGFQSVSYISYLFKTQDSISRALLQARKMHWWGSGVTHGHAEMGENDQKSVNGYVLFRVGGKQIQCVPVVFFLVNTQYSFPRIMFQARKMCRRGTGDTHGHARMGKNDDSPKRATFCWRWVKRGFKVCQLYSFWPKYKILSPE